jgi:hypothetical protein
METVLYLQYGWRSKSSKLGGEARSNGEAKLETVGKVGSGVNGRKHRQRENSEKREWNRWFFWFFLLLGRRTQVEQMLGLRV